MNYLPIQFDTEGGFSITNAGTAPAPCKITIIPRIDIIRLEIVGLSADPITIDNIYSGDVLVIDGEEGKATVNEVSIFHKYNAWELPKLQPGVNYISITNSDACSISIEYDPRYI